MLTAGALPIPGHRPGDNVRVHHWAEVGDVAQDLAYIESTVYGGPDCVPMDNDLIAHFVAHYVTAMRAAGKDTEDEATLIAGRAGWKVSERFLTTLHTTTNCQDDKSASDTVTRFAGPSLKRSARSEGQSQSCTTK